MTYFLTPQTLSTAASQWWMFHRDLLGGLNWENLIPSMWPRARVNAEAWVWRTFTACHILRCQFWLLAFRRDTRGDSLLQNIRKCSLLSLVLTWSFVIFEPCFMKRGMYWDKPSFLDFCKVKTIRTYQSLALVKGRRRSWILFGRVPRLNKHLLKWLSRGA